MNNPLNPTFANKRDIELNVDGGKYVLACFSTRNYFEWIINNLGGCYYPDNTLLDVHNSSDDTQPHPIIVNYQITVSTRTYKSLIEFMTYQSLNAWSIAWHLTIMYSMSARWIWVGYNHLISNKREWNNYCFIKNVHKLSKIHPNFICENSQLSACF